MLGCEMTKEYLKMADVFEGRISSLYTTEVHDKCGCVCDAESGEWARYIAHAINSHDELVAEVWRLRGHLSQVKELCAHFAECGGWDVDDYSEYSNANVNR